MVWLALFVVCVALTIIGLMPGSTYDRELPVILVLAGFALFLLVFFLRMLREDARNAKQTKRDSDEWSSARERRQDLRSRRRASSRSRSRSRVLGFGSGPGSGKPRVRQASLRHQDDLRVKQGMQYAREERFKGMRGAESNSELRKQDDLRERRKKDRERYMRVWGP